MGKAIMTNVLGLNAAHTERLYHELLLAKQMQAALLPGNHLPDATLDLAARTMPARIVSGDFYDFAHYPVKEISAAALGDVSGKGPSAAIYAALVMGILRSLEAVELGPAQMLQSLNTALLKRPVQAHYVCLMCAIWDEGPRLFKVANSGLPHPIWIRKDKVAIVDAIGLPLGLFKAPQYREHVFECELGDTVVFFTDGVTEAVDSDGQEFGRARLERVVWTCLYDSAQKTLDAIFSEIATHTRGVEQLDDQTVIVVKT